MQDMRRLIALLVLVLSAQLVGAGEIKITTWNLKWFPSGLANRRDPAVEATRITAAASVLREIDPDIVLLQEVRDEESALQLLDAVAPKCYEIATVSRFRDNAGIGWQQVVIAAKVPAAVAYARPWRTVGLVDPPRGFAFAAFSIGSQRLAVYAVHLKSNLTQGDPFRAMQLNILKRELAAQQLLEHVSLLPDEIGFQPHVIVVGGDFNTSPDDPRFVSEKTLQAFKDECFLNPIMRLVASERITLPGEGRYPPATFDHLLVRGVETTAVGVQGSTVSDHRPVTVTLSIP